jgi:hypothetical protein
MSTAVKFAALYEDQPGYITEDEVNELDVESDGTREDMFAPLSKLEPILANTHVLSIASTIL